MVAASLPEKGTVRKEIPSGKHLGKTVIHDGQEYRAMSSKRYMRKDGVLTTLTTWESNCPDCGVVFRFEAGSRSPSKLRRRCDKHKHAGKPVTVQGAWRMAMHWMHAKTGEHRGRS